jgi:hypothetical protein
VAAPRGQHLDDLARPVAQFLAGWVFRGFIIAVGTIAAGVLFAILAIVISTGGMRDF